MGLIKVSVHPSGHRPFGHCHLPVRLFHTRALGPVLPTSSPPSGAGVEFPSPCRATEKPRTHGLKGPGRGPGRVPRHLPGRSLGTWAQSEAWEQHPGRGPFRLTCLSILKALFTLHFVLKT